MRHKFHVLSAIFLFSFQLIQAQTDKKADNDNRFFNEIGISKSFFIFDGEGGSINLDGANYFTSNLGLRSGIFLITDIADAEWGIKVPILFSARTNTNQNRELNYENSTSTADYIIQTLSIIPTKWEINIGPSFGYIDTEDYTLTEDEKLKKGGYYINTKPMFTVDANGKLSFVLYRVNIDLSLGVSYLCTKNIKYYDNDKYADKNIKTQRWIGNFTIGTSYRF